MKKKYRIIYLGTWGYGRAGLEALNEIKKADILTVFTRYNTHDRDDYFNQVYNLASISKIPIVNTEKEHITKKDLRVKLLDLSYDFLICCCYDRFIAKDIISNAKIASINVHTSFLPKYRGIKPLENALINPDENEIGITVHFLSEKYDSGDIILQDKFYFSPSNTYKELYEKQCIMIKSLLKEFFQAPDSYLKSAFKQNDEMATEAPRLKISFKDEMTVADIRNIYSGGQDIK
jgi:methionyl-tRNA formyltransferase